MKMIYRGYEIKYHNGSWSIFQGELHLHSVTSEEEAYKWIDAKIKLERKGSK